MILQDLAGIILSSFSLFAKDFFRLAWRNLKRLRNQTEDESLSNSTVVPESTIHEQLINNHDYGTFPTGGTRLQRSRICNFFLNSIWTSVTILIAALPLGFFATVLLFADLNTVNLCSEWIEQKSFPVDGTILRWKLVGDVIEDLGLFFWFPSTIIFLFGWKEFKAHYLVILFVCFSAACVEIIYKLFLFILNAYAEKEIYYHLAGNVCFFTSILCSSYLIAVKIRKTTGDLMITPPKILTMATVCAQFVFAFVIGLTGRYFIIPVFTKLQNQYIKAILAAITPTVTLVPMAVCKQLALLSNVFSNSRNHFILVYFVYGATIIVYRVMQAEVKNLWLFIGLSVFHGLMNVVGKATEKLRYKLWIRIFRALKKFRCCRQMELQVHSSSYHQRLDADKEIQTMLYDYVAMVLSQSYRTLYLITNFNTKSGGVPQESPLKRIVIGLSIDMFFNTFSILARDYMYNIPVQQVWKENWKVHLKANAVTAAMTIWYFSPILLTVVHIRVDDPNYILRNCTAPISY